MASYTSSHQAVWSTLVSVFELNTNSAFFTHLINLALFFLPTQIFLHSGSRCPHQGLLAWVLKSIFWIILQPHYQISQSSIQFHWIQFYLYRTKSHPQSSQSAELLHNLQQKFAGKETNYHQINYSDAIITFSYFCFQCSSPGKKSTAVQCHRKMILFYSLQNK